MPLPALLEPLCIKFETESVKTPSEHFFPEFPNIYLSRDIKSVSELYGQMLHYLLTTLQRSLDSMLHYTFHFILEVPGSNGPVPIQGFIQRSKTTKTA
jgi:hypothetical protein